ncbi:protein of unknown function DUF1503 [Beutenbergia cavernae DSM 12333]|uniref:Mycothiol-dependent maleylpyruvate isomerase metal-binding domain-containing protein n=1 Tax=Beutenbergia cavernae (strain ATCC BAA-8 / DSM 12333 / CCUG 43141 / JCM 11478 / NBRC 16432 / NCIMB 13614 / HKI 0122) TaxID=471853 RepID=C5BZ45_BEUC1|nr:maleylpyruvate isomerase N-terminal domain-containing protein [Beutenbergia cavernae]ACQ81160.1 protein of unknown function DUF1503 [Beutenbergia cavernae DSM 12333]
MDLLDVIARESDRFRAAVSSGSGGARVPACPDWTAADLTYHLAEVQHFWAQVAGGATGADAEELARPEEAELLAAFDAASGRLRAELARRDPEEPAWSWSETGGTIAWVLRRQAHEALVHRVDAEQTAGLAVSEPEPALAADGVDELFTVSVDNAPGWGTVTLDGRRARVSATDAVTHATAGGGTAPSVWTLAFGRFTGTGPESGTQFDWDAARLEPTDDAGAVDVEISGRAWDLDLWLWGRGDAGPLHVTGDAALVPRLRGVVAEATQ